MQDCELYTCSSEREPKVGRKLLSSRRACELPILGYCYDAMPETTVPPLVLPLDEIALDTRSKRHIKNSLDRNKPIPGKIAETQNAIKEHFTTIPRTTTPCIKYNCHGLTFAARRTAIDDTSEVQKILHHDGYVLIKQCDALPGDVAIWRASAALGGEIIHSGIVVEVGQGNDRKLFVPRVVSKWGGMHEAIHRVTEGPYRGTIEYYRVMP